MLPSTHFAPAGEPAALDPAKETYAHALDRFETSGQSWVVASSWSGLPVLLPAQGLPANLQEDLEIHQASTDVLPRSLAAKELYLFALDSLQQRLDVRGPNDPVSLHGKLVGPFLSGEPPQVTQGKLKLTRADVLEGIVRSLSTSFLYARTRGEDAVARQCYHLLAPGRPEAEIGQGRGLVLVYPMKGLAEEGETGNELQTRELCFEVLSAFQEDLRAENDPSALADATLPVPDLEQHKAQLKLQGVTIEGDAIRETPPKDSGWFKKLYYSMFPERTPLPPEATTLCYASLAHLALEALANWPTPASEALWARISANQVFWTAELGDGLRPIKAENGGFVLKDGALTLSLPEFKFAVDDKGNLQEDERSYLHFDICDRFAAGLGERVEVEIQFLDEGSEAFAFQYQAANDQPAEAEPIQRAASGSWRSVTFTVSGARYENGLPGGADFRLAAGPTNRALSVRRVVVRKPTNR